MTRRAALVLLFMLTACDNVPPFWVQASCQLMVQQKEYPNLAQCFAAAKRDHVF